MEGRHELKRNKGTDRGDSAGEADIDRARHAGDTQDLKLKISWHQTAPTKPAASPPMSDESVTIVRSPIAGRFLLGPVGRELPFVKEGDSVNDGTILCIIEAHGVQNEIEAEVAGRIEKVLGENGAQVEVSEPLFTIISLQRDQGDA